MMGAPVRLFIRPPKKGQYERLKKRKSINLVGLVLSQLLSLYRMSLYLPRTQGNYQKMFLGGRESLAQQLSSWFKFYLQMLRRALAVVSTPLCNLLSLQSLEIVCRLELQ